MAEDAVERLSVGVDWAQDNGEETVVVFARSKPDGFASIIAELRGEAAEYVARLEQALEAQRRENERLKAILEGRHPDSGWARVLVLEQENDRLRELLQRAERNNSLALGSGMGAWSYTSELQGDIDAALEERASK